VQDGTSCLTEFVSEKRRLKRPESMQARYARLLRDSHLSRGNPGMGLGPVQPEQVQQVFRRVTGRSS